MKVHRLLLQPRSRKCQDQGHSSRVLVDRPKARWCFDALEIGCDKAEKGCVAFALDCRDQEAMGQLATAGDITSECVCKLMVAIVEHRFGPVSRLAELIGWLTGNDSPYVAGDKRRFARDVDRVPRTMPVSSPETNGMAEALVHTRKRDHVRVNPTPDARIVTEQLPAWLSRYNEVHPRKALGFRSPREHMMQTH